MDEQALKTLEIAISDVGYWQWWTSELPDYIQLEFGGVQLWFPPDSPGLVPSSLAAIRLLKPVLAIFLTGKEAELPDDWPESMQRDELEPFSITYERFTLTSHDDAMARLAEAASMKPLVGAPSAMAKYRGSPLLAFQARSVGFVGVAESIELVSMQGEIDLTSVPELHRQWWAYWREYWARKDTADPMPEDFACEVCIPAGSEDDDEEGRQ